MGVWYFENIDQVQEFVATCSGVYAGNIGAYIPHPSLREELEREGLELLDLETMEPVVGTIDGEEVAFLVGRTVEGRCWLESVPA